MCGKEAQLFKVEIEGTELNVCSNCSKFGKVITPVKVEIKKWKKQKIAAEEPKKEVAFAIADDYADRIKTARERLGIKQEDFAKKINEKESVIHKVETGHFEPSLSLAMKIERFLKIKLIEQYEESHIKKTEEKNDSFTIGDVLKTK